MKVKEFCQKAIENGYQKANTCIGWTWIEQNLALLDDVFQSPEYLDCKGMNHKCMPVLIGQENLTEDEKAALSTAWYLQNCREDKRRKQEYRDKMLADGWQLLNETVCQKAIEQGRKIELAGKVTSDWLTTKVAGLFRPTKNAKGQYFLIAPRKRNRGYFLGNLVAGGHEDCFCKIA